LLQASVYGLTTTLAALFLSNRIGNWINILSRLNTYKVTLFIQKASIVISAILFHYLDSSEGAQNVLYAFIIVLGCTLKLSFIGNSIAIEKDWAMIISDGHLEQPLSTMRRIDLVCKTLSPIFIGYLLSASSLVITLVICAWTAVSTIAEYILVSQLYLNVPGLGVRSPHNPTSSATGEEEASVPISIREYVQHRTFLATLALGMLYMNVLSFGGTMTAYLVLIGYNSGLLGIMKAVAGIMGVAGTYIMPLLAKRLGNIRTGLWSIWQLALTLALVVVALTNKLDYMAASRLGLWMFDIAENLILQEYTAPIHITSITGWQYSL
jgi:iron-regulated transporter 1